MTQAPFTTRPELKGHFGMVTTTHWLASGVGMAVLEKGGNAFDAAVAAGFTLQIAEPHLNGPGGELPAIFWAEKDGKPVVLSAQGGAPAAASIKTMHDLGLDTIPGSGVLPAVVPGAFDGWLRLLSDYGTMTLREVLHYAIGYAENGVPVLPKIADFIRRVAPLFNDHWTTSAEIYLSNGKAPEAGTWLTNRKIAETYSRILDEAEAASGDRKRQIEAARDIWYKGWVSEAIDRFHRKEQVLDSSGRKHSGLLTGDDLANWTSHYEIPQTLAYGNHTVCKCGFWSQGPVLLQQLALLRDMDVSRMDPLGAPFVHTVTEAAKLAFADREAWYGDPDHVDVPARTLLSDDYAHQRRKLIGENASMDLNAGNPDGREADLTAALSGNRDLGDLGHYFSLGEPTVSPAGEFRGDTVHIDVVDSFGNMIAATPSGGWLQSAPVIPELGFCMSVRGQMFWLDESSPSSLAPGKRPRTTLSPSMSLRNGEPYMVWGTPGGDQQDQWSLLLFLHHVEHGMNLQEAIDAPAFHSEHFPSSFWPRGSMPGRLVVEGRFPAGTINELKDRGHDLSIGGDWSEGRLSAALRDGKIIKAAANSRGMQGYAAGR